MSRLILPEMTLNEAGIPTEWTFHAGNPVLEKTDFAGIGSGNGMGYPTVIKAAGRLASPIDDWYMWCSPHDNSEGVFVATAPDPLGPWTPANSGNGIDLAATTNGALDMAAPFVLWNPDTSELWLWAHGRRANTQQPTWFWKSTDGINWTVQNSGNAVLDVGVVPGPDADDLTAAYLTAVVEDGEIHAVYQGVSTQSPTLPNGAKEAHVMRAASVDGLAWRRLGSQANDPGDHKQQWDSPANRDSGRPVPVLIGDRLYCFYSQGGVSPSTGWVRQFLRNGTWSERFESGFAGTGTGWAAHKQVPSDFVVDDGTIYCYFTGDPTSANTDDEAIGIASAPLPDAAGFVTAWGKG